MTRVERPYKLRYRVDPWGKVPTGQAVKVASGIRIMQGPWGYADELFIVSIVKDKTSKESWMILDTRAPVNPTKPTVKQLTEVRDFLNHLIEHHASEFPSDPQDVPPQASEETKA